MSGLFKSKPFHDPQLGTLVRTGGRWKGRIAIDADRSVPLHLSGSRRAPDPEGLGLAYAFPVKSCGWSG